MKYRLPEDCVGLSFEGKAITIAADHTIDADPGAAAALAAHGILRADEPSLDPPRGKARPEKKP